MMSVKVFDKIGKKRRNKIRGLRPGIFMYILVSIVCIIAVFPFYWLLNTSLQPQSELYKLPINFFPTKNIFNSYFDYISNSKISVWLFNSFIVSGLVCILSTVIGVPCAYAISRFNFRMKTPIILLVLFTQMMAAAFLCIPLYMIFSRLALVNTRTGLIIIYTCTTLPISIWFSKGFFDSIPSSLDESARVDGANTLQVLLRILLPLLRPGIIATGTWVFIASWDEYLYAYTMLSDTALWTNSVGLASYVGQYNTPWNEIMSGAILVTLPVVLLFMYFQKYIVAGITSGSVKG
ncbi:MAG: carbohydrate ABC transporter permease [Clostridia bacterium]|nr:carbohydrate ABC transporter permease [Clostridia bacterium]